MSIPVTILGGFLGAGKTTALNHLLRRGRERIGVLVNDFGAINIDAHLIEAAEADLVALSNGCVCCALGPDLGASLDRVAARQPDRIVIEASGVADPWRIAQLVRLEPGMTLDAVLVLADATSFAAQSRDRYVADTVARQVARADLVLLSKTDIATTAELYASRAALLQLRPDVPVAEIHGGTLPDLVLGNPAPAGSRFVADAPEHGFRTWLYRNDDAFDEDRLRQVLASLPSSVLRAKGFCRLGDIAQLHLLQLVGRRFTLAPWPHPAEPGLVLIGTDRMPADADLAAMFERAKRPESPRP